MRRLPLAFAVSLLVTAPALAQGSAPPNPPDGPPAGMQQQMATARANARTAAFAALASDHQTKIAAIVDQVKGGQLTDVRAAAQKIDAILTPKESQAVLAARDKLRSDMRAQAGSAPNGPPGGGPPPGDGPPLGGGFGGRGRGEMQALRDDAGFALLSLSLEREQLRSLMMPPRDRN